MDLSTTHDANNGQSLRKRQSQNNRPNPNNPDNTTSTLLTELVRGAQARIAGTRRVVGSLSEVPVGSKAGILGFLASHVGVSEMLRGCVPDPIDQCAREVSRLEMKIAQLLTEGREVAAKIDKVKAQKSEVVEEIRMLQDSIHKYSDTVATFQNAKKTKAFVGRMLRDKQLDLECELTGVWAKIEQLASERAAKKIALEALHPSVLKRDRLLNGPKYRSVGLYNPVIDHTSL